MGYPTKYQRNFRNIKQHNIKIIEDSSFLWCKDNDEYVGSFGSVDVLAFKVQNPLQQEKEEFANQPEEIYKKLNFYGHFGRIVIPKSSSLSLYSEKTGYGKKLRANPLGIKIVQIDLIFFNYTNKIKYQNFQK